MEIYKNDFLEQEDGLLWELHEIRHKLAEEYKSLSIEQINKRAVKYWEKIKKRQTKKINI